MEYDDIISIMTGSLSAFSVWVTGDNDCHIISLAIGVRVAGKPVIFCQFPGEGDEKPCSVFGYINPKNISRILIQYGVARLIFLVESDWQGMWA